MFDMVNCSRGQPRDQTSRKIGTELKQIQATSGHLFRTGHDAQHRHRDLYSSGHGQSKCALRKILEWPLVTARHMGPKGPGISIIWEENEDFEISTPCTKCFKPQLAWK
jgi:hypothetical protein